MVSLGSATANVLAIFIMPYGWRPWVAALSLPSLIFVLLSFVSINIRNTEDLVWALVIIINRLEEYCSTSTAPEGCLNYVYCSTVFMF